MRTPTGARIHVFETIETMSEAFARELTTQAVDRIAEQGMFSLALTGGRTPAPFYRRLAEREFLETVPWNRVKIFFGDERPVAPTDPQSNFKMAWETWLEQSPIPRDQIFRLEGESADLEDAAERYSITLTHQLPNGPSGFPALDLVLLGLGTDGHTASLFPRTMALDETLRLVVANEVPQLESRRLTLTYPTINAAHEAWFLVTGAEKAEAVAMCIGLQPGGEMLPAAMVHATGGRVRWWLDRAAAAQLPNP